MVQSTQQLQVLLMLLSTHYLQKWARNWSLLRPRRFPAYAAMISVRHLCMGDRSKTIRRDLIIALALAATLTFPCGLLLATPASAHGASTVRADGDYGLYHVIIAT